MRVLQETREFDEVVENVPFQKGDRVEYRSFLDGYQGAWFRCRLKKISLKKSGKNSGRHVVHCTLDYEDHETVADLPCKVYPRPNGVPTKACMLRPPYPPIIDMPPSAVSGNEAYVVKVRDYEPGDFVEWDFEACHWICQVAQMDDADHVYVVCPGPPWGVGGPVYRVSKGLLRPALDWSPVLGWRVPLPTNFVVSMPCAQVLNPKRGTRLDLPIELSTPFDGRDWALQVPRVYSPKKRGRKRREDSPTENPEQAKALRALKNIAAESPDDGRITTRHALKRLVRQSEIAQQEQPERDEEYGQDGLSVPEVQGDHPVASPSISRKTTPFEVYTESHLGLLEVIMGAEESFQLASFCKDTLKYDVEESLRMREETKWVVTVMGRGGKVVFTSFG